MKPQLCFFKKTFSSIHEYTFLLTEHIHVGIVYPFEPINTMSFYLFVVVSCGDPGTAEYTFLVTEHLHVEIVFSS